jgi:alpha-tubulin suppressor-like RCC1 family protein
MTRFSILLLAACGSHSAVDIDAATPRDGATGSVDGATSDATSDGASTSDAPPATPSGPHRLSLSDAHSCYLDMQGTAYCWGADDAGQLGDGATKQAKWTAAAVINLPGPASEIAAGGVLLDGHSMARFANGSVRGWGANQSGQLGDNSKTAPATVTTTSGLTASELVTSFSHSCARTSANATTCWGSNGYGQLALPATMYESLVPSTINLPAATAEVGVGSYYTCARLSDSRVYCWGRNNYGQTGAAGIDDQYAPIQIQGLSGAIAQLGVAYWHSCAVDGNGGVKCWGANYYGQLGNGSTTNAPTPTAVAVTGLAGAVVSVCGGNGHSCALLATGGVQCWGWNYRGQLGDGTQMNRSTPVTVSGLSGVVELACGGEHNCARVATGVRCWGANYWGELGDNTNQHRSTPVTVQGL